MLRQRRYRTVGYGDDANVTAGSERHDVDRQAGIAGKANANQHILLIELSKLVNRITAARIDKADRSNHPAEVMIECKRKTEGTSKTQNVRFPGPSHQCNSLIETRDVELALGRNQILQVRLQRSRDRTLLNAPICERIQSLHRIKVPPQILLKRAPQLRIAIVANGGRKPDDSRLRHTELLGNARR